MFSLSRAVGTLRGLNFQRPHHALKIGATMLAFNESDPDCDTVAETDDNGRVKCVTDKRRTEILSRLTG